MRNYVSILKDLVSFDVLGGQSNLSILKYIEDYLKEYGVDYHLVPNIDGLKASLHARIGPSSDGGLILSGHMDVVPVDGQDWHTNPFVLTEKDGKLYGRGSCDMKAFLACVLAMVPEMVKANLQKPFYLAFSYDEEIGCLAGVELAETIRNYYDEKPAFCLVGEPSMMQPILGHKGIIIYKTSVLGSAGHSSRIKNEVSAIHVAARLICWLEDKMAQLKETDNRFEPNHTSIHVGKIVGGIAPNVIADKCHFFWDVRQIPQTNLNALLEEFFDYCTTLEKELQKKFKGAKIVHEEDHPNVVPLDTKENAEVVRFLLKHTERQDLGTVAYAAEAGQFSEAGFQTMICGPGDIAQAHRANEFVSIEQLEKCMNLLRSINQNFKKT